MSTLPQRHHHLPATATATATTSSNVHHPRSSARRPLQPVNSTFSGIKVEAAKKEIPNANLIKPSRAGEFGKENVAAKAFVVEELQEMGSTLSLEEELMAVRKKVERMRIDRKRTERLMDERSAVLDAKMRELDEKGEVQKELEMEVDRLYRLKQLKSTFAWRVAPMRSLKEMEQSRKSEAGSEVVFREIKLESPRSSVASAKSISMEE